MYYVYVLQSTAGDLYYGSTNDLRRRLSEHADGKSFTTRGREWGLAYYEAYKAESDARRRESQIKRHGHAKRWLKDRIQDSLQEKISAGLAL
ncbi:MAG: GIY-YIG nuclease family protein [Minisyncoccota bacterium]